MATIQSLLDDLNASSPTKWTIVGTGTPIEETKTSQYPGLVSGDPVQTGVYGTGNYYVTIQDDQGHQRAMMLKPQPIKGGLVVRQSGVNDVAKDAKGNPDPKGTPPSNIYTGDLKSIQWDSGGPIQDVPATPNKPKEPSTTAQLDKLDADGNDATKSGKPPVTLRDPATGTTIALPKDPAGTLTTINNTPMVVKPDGTATAVVGPDGKPITVTKDKTQMNVPGVGLVEYDPSKTGSDAYNVIVKTPTGIQAKDLQPQKVNGKVYIAVDDGKGGVTWQETNLPESHVYTVAAGGNDPRSPNITLIDEQGNSTTVKKEGWTPPPNPQSGSAITPSTDAPFVVTIGDNGQPIFTDNKNKLSISDAQKQLIQQLGGKVADGSMTEKSAQDLISSMTSAMTARATQQNAAANMLTAQTGQQRLGVDAANNALTAVNNAAQTGAGLLQNRVTNAMSGLNTAIGAIGSSKMTSAPAGMGENLVGGLSEWVTGLGGGQPVYDSAAAMVNAANPAVKGDPTVASQAYAALRGAMDLYKQQTGQEWQPQQPFNSPVTAPTGAAAGTAGGGASPVQTNVSVQQNLGAQQQAAAVAAGTAGRAPTATLNARGLMDNPQGRAMAGGQVPVAAGGAPLYPGQYNPAYQQGIRSAVGQPANPATVVGSTQIPVLPIPGYSPYGPLQFQAPVTV
jgi:hypothetical protein